MEGYQGVAIEEVSYSVKGVETLDSRRDKLLKENVGEGSSPTGIIKIKVENKSPELLLEKVLIQQ